MEQNQHRQPPELSKGLSAKAIQEAERQTGLSTHSLCDQLVVGQFERLGVRMRIAARQNIFIENDPMDSIYMLSRGFACLYKASPCGRRRIVGFALPGDFLVSLLSPHYAYSADATGNTVVYRFPYDRFLSFLCSNPQISYYMLKSVSRELDRVRDQICLVGSGSAEERLVEFLIGWRRRLARRRIPSNTLPLPMTRYDIADFLGLGG